MNSSWDSALAKCVQSEVPTSEGFRFLLYSHDGLGMGHTRRNLAVAAALNELSPNASVLLASGYEDIHRLNLPPGVIVLKLPSLRKVANDQYLARRLPIECSDLFVLRSALLKAAVRSFQPDVLLVDKHPMGVKKELRPALKVHREAGGFAALGLREILDDRATVLREWHAHDMHGKIERYYDRVLIYGDRDFYDPANEYEFTEAMLDRSCFCGFVVERTEVEPSESDALASVLSYPPEGPIVLATAGGGEDGFEMLKVFIDAARHENWQGLVVTGPMMSAEERRALELLAAEAKVKVYDFVPNLPRWFARADTLVCMGGYNTLWEALHQGTPVVCVPRTQPRQEQWVRAKALEKRGLLRLVQPGLLNGDRLAAEIKSALRESRTALKERFRATLRHDGARQAARHLIHLATRSTVRTQRIERTDAVFA